VYILLLHFAPEEEMHHCVPHIVSGLFRSKKGNASLCTPYHIWSILLRKRKCIIVYHVLYPIYSAPKEELHHCVLRTISGQFCSKRETASLCTAYHIRYILLLKRKCIVVYCIPYPVYSISLRKRKCIIVYHVLYPVLFRSKRGNVSF